MSAAPGGSVIRAKIDHITPNWLDVGVSGELSRIMGTFDFGLRVTYYDGTYDELLELARTEQEFMLVPVEFTNTSTSDVLKASDDSE